MISNRRDKKAQRTFTQPEGAQHSIESMQLFALTSSLWQFPTLHQSIEHFLERLAQTYDLDVALVFNTPKEEPPQLYAEVGIGKQYHHHLKLPVLLLEHILAAPKQVLHFQPAVEIEVSTPILERDILFTATIPLQPGDTIQDAISTPAPTSSVSGESQASIAGPTAKKPASFTTPRYQVENPQDAIFGQIPQKFVFSLAIAIRVGTSLEGVLVLARSRQEPLSTRELSMIRYLGQQAALAMTYRRRLADNKKTEKMLRDTQRLHHLILEATQEGIWGWDIKHDRLYLSGRWKQLLGYPENTDEIGDNPENWTDRIHKEDQVAFTQKMQAHIEGETPYFEVEHRLKCQSGTYRWMRCRGIAERQEETVRRLVGTLTDIHDQKMELEKYQHHALHDPLTNLPNRALLLDRLGQAVKKRQRQKDYRFAVLFIDLDQFKQINDTLGHHVGDQLLRSVAHRLRTCLRTGDTIARLGGDEFVLLLDNLDDTKSANEVAQRIQSSLHRPFLFQGNEVRVTSSIGITVSADHYTHPEELLQDADTAMYQAKQLGREEYCNFVDLESPQASTRHQLKKDLHLALHHEQLRLQYQPIVSLETGDIVGFEALVRWQHPERGLLLPNEFLPASEETGQIVPMTWWILQEACQQMKQWQTQFQTVPPLDIHVNLSSQVLTHPDLVSQVERCLRETGLAPFSLHIELKEEALLNNTNIMKDLCEELVKHYVHFDLDDFGTGFSSISHLHHFPLHTIKIDRSFVKAMGDDRITNNIIRTILLVANELGIDLVAEGVEDAQQSQLLQELQCPHAQGYFFAQPMSPASAETYLQRFF